MAEYERLLMIPGPASSAAAWMAGWLAAFLESNADDLAEKDAIVLDQIREAIQEGTE